MAGMMQDNSSGGYEDARNKGPPRWRFVRLRGFRLCFGFGDEPDYGAAELRSNRFKVGDGCDTARIRAHRTRWAQVSHDHGRQKEWN